MKIKTKFLWSIYVLIALFGISVLGVSFCRHGSTCKAINTILICLDELEMVSQLELALSKAIMPANDYLIHGKEDEIHIFEELDADVNKYFSLLEGGLFPTHIMRIGHNILNKLKGQYLQIKTLSDKILSIPDPVGYVEGAHLMEEMDLLMDNMLDDAKELHKCHRLAVLVEVEVISANFHRSVVIVSIIFGFVMIALIIYGLFLTRGIIVPIERLTAYMSNVTKSDFGQRLDIKAKDEIGALANSFNKMVEDLQKTTVSRDYVDNIVRSITDLLIVVTPDARIQMVNQAVCELLGYKEDELLKQYVGVIFAKEEEEEEEEEEELFSKSGISDLINSGFVANVEKSCLTKDGSKIPVLFSGAVMRSEEGKIQGIVCIVKDITGQKKAEEQIKSSLKEKEVLLKEIHHRVKNNLQIIASVLHLQSRLTQDKAVLDILDDIQSRVQSMALVHKHLYNAEDLAGISLKEYISDLSGRLIVNYSKRSGTVTTKLEVEDLRFTVDTIIPIGLIINELITNSLKYAFPEREGNEIKIVVKSADDDKFELIVSDNGIGIPDGLDIRNVKTLGLRLIMTLAEMQLGGKVEVKSDQGTEFRITFKEIKKIRRQRLWGKGKS